MVVEAGMHSPPYIDRYNLAINIDDEHLVLSAAGLHPKDFTMIEKILRLLL